MAQPGMRSANLPFVFSHENHDSLSTLQERILDRCLLVAEKKGKVCAVAGIDLDRNELSELMISPAAFEQGLFESLLAEVERLAVRFGLQQLNVVLPATAGSRFRALAYRVSDCKAAARRSDPGLPQCYMEHSLARRQTRYGRRVRTLGDELGIPADYGRRHRLALQLEATRLVTIGMDVFGREQLLAPRAALAWRRMQIAAAVEGIDLQTVSAWRTVSYQCEVLRRKLKKGLGMEEILKVSAAPGFSEHHTGRAIDVTTPGFVVLEEEFERSPAFHWMERRAQDFAFRLSFPRNNRNQLAYEPWHWYFDG